MSIQTVQGGTREISSVYGGATLNASALVQPALANARLGQSIAQVGGIIGEFAQKKQNAINVAAIADGQNQMNKLFASYQDEMKTMDEDKWLPTYQTKTQALKDSLLNDDQVSNDAKEMLKLHLDRQISVTTSQVNTQAQNRVVQRQTAKLTNAAHDAWDAGDYETGAAAVTAAEHAHLLFPEEADHLREQGKEIVDKSKINHALITDPISALDQLEDQTEGGRWRNFTNIEENERRALIVDARRQVSAVRAETMNGLADRRNNGEIVGRDELEQLVGDRKITAQQMSYVLKQQGAQVRPGEQVKLRQKLMTQLDHYDYQQDANSSDPNSVSSGILGEALALPPAWQTEIRSRLDDARTRKGTAGTVKPGNELITHLLEGGFLGQIKGDVTEETPGKFFGTNTVTRKVNASDIEAAYLRANQLRDDLNEFVKANPKATDAEQVTFLNGRVSKQVDTKAATPILNVLSGRSAAVPQAPKEVQITSEAQFRSLPSGTPFTYNGRSGTKK